MAAYNAEATTSEKKVSTYAQEKIDVSIPEYLSIDNPVRILDSVSIGLTDHSYLPRVDDLQSDWVAHVAAPAFRLIRKERGTDIPAFCSIGTGSGLDVLTGIEILGATRAGLTDVHKDVVITAVDNVTHNLKKGHQVTIEAGFGDLLEPLRKFNSRYDVIYENLPNVPASNDVDATTDRKSSTHVPPRRESIPELIRRQMLDLHYLALVQSKDFLEKNGAVISTLGGRVPLELFIELGKLAGYSPSILSYTWKIQAVPESVIRDHADRQDEGFGPFYFYHAEDLQKTFAAVSIEESGRRAFELEKYLLQFRLDAPEAYRLWSEGARIGHTVAVLKSEIRS